MTIRWLPGLRIAPSWAGLREMLVRRSGDPLSPRPCPIGKVAIAQYDIPNIVFIDLITVHLPKARWFRDCKGDKFYVSPDVTTIPTTQAAQNYSDEVTRALEAAGFKVMKLVLSKNVHECYKLAKCENANLPYLATHPCIAWANSITLRGSIAEIQEFYATRLFMRILIST